MKAILGRKQAQVATLGVSRADDPDKVLVRARSLAEGLDSGAGVLVLTDMFGATPCNVASRLLADVKGNSVLVEAPVGQTSRFADTTVAAAPWPRGTVPLSIDRHSQLITPRPETVLQPHDVVMAVVPAAGEDELRRRLDGSQ